MVMHGGSFRNSVLMTLIYATGLRLGEVARLRLVDINSQNMTLHIRNGKGAKDRVLPLPADLLPLLRDYFRQYKPEVYLFNGGSKGGPMAHRTIQYIVASARVAAGIKRPASVHTLRHCFATHFYQNGSNSIALQFMLGHKNFKTTARYVHLSGEYYRLLYNPAATICQQLSTPSQ
jgi:integrase/recombinase XerD